MRATARARKGDVEHGVALRLVAAMGLVANPRAESPNSCPCPRAWRSRERCRGADEGCPWSPPAAGKPGPLLVCPPKGALEEAVFPARGALLRVPTDAGSGSAMFPLQPEITGHARGLSADEEETRGEGARGGQGPSMIVLSNG
eukprot:4184150-Heterocapsa_arctica.AAC.1